MARQLSAYMPVSPVINGGRLTLVSNDPIPTADQTAKTTLYFLPFVGQQIALYNGSSWVIRDIGSSGISLTVANFPSGGAASTLYDIYCYDNSGTPALEALAWTSAGAGTSARATALVYQDGILSKTGALTRRYLGTVYLNGSTQLTSSQAFRGIQNWQNKVKSADWKEDTTASWTMTSQTYAAMNAGNAAWKREFIVGWLDQPVEAEAQVLSTCPGGGTTFIGIGLNAITIAAKGVTGESSSGTSLIRTHIIDWPPVGYNYYQVVQAASGATATFYGSQNSGSSRLTGAMVSKHWY